MALLNTNGNYIKVEKSTTDGKISYTIYRDQQQRTEGVQEFEKTYWTERCCSTYRTLIKEKANGNKSIKNNMKTKAYVALKENVFPESTDC